MPRPAAGPGGQRGPIGPGLAAGPGGHAAGPAARGAGPRPGLGTGGAEVPALAPLYGDVTVLGDAAATSGRLLAAMDGAWLAHVAPHLVILPCCDSGRLAPAGADELLGLVSCLLPLGTAGVVASVAPLNDLAAVPLMLALHQRLRSGQTLAESLCAIRRQVRNDPVLLGAAWSLVALGAG